MKPEELRTMRIAAGYTQEQLAKLLHVHRMTINRWETGAVPIPHKVVLTLLNYIGHVKK